MMQTILSIGLQQIWWYIPLSLLIGICYAALLYLIKRKKNSFTPLLFILRTLAVAGIIYLLLDPTIKSITTIEEKPILVMAFDNSSSIKMNKDSAFIQKEFLRQINQLSTKLEEKFTVKQYSFGEQLLSKEAPLNFQDQKTNFANLFDAIDNNYSHQNICGTLLFSDGIQNDGPNPLYSLSLNEYPIFPVVMGDTSVTKDAKISQIQNNKTTFIGHKFPVKIHLEFLECKEDAYTLSIKNKDSTFIEQQITISNSSYFYDKTFLLPANRKGLLRYTVNLSHGDNEITYTNNHQDFFINVIEKKQKVLLLSNSPHPDIKALTRTLKTDTKIEIEQQSYSYSSNLDYQLIIAHQPTVIGKTLLSRAMKKNIPIFYLLGNKTDWTFFNQIQNYVSVTGKQYTEATAESNNSFTLFNKNKSFNEQLKDFPPLETPLSTISIKAETNTLLYQKINGINTTTPLLTFLTTSKPRIGILFGEGIWRWRISDYLHNENFDAFDQTFLNCIQLLASKENNSPFTIQHKTIYAAHENIVFDAELHTQTHELTNTPKANLTIINEAGEKFYFTFQKNNQTYTINIGQLPPGAYSFLGKVQLGKQNYDRKGSFIVKKSTLEATNTKADINFLNQLANKSKGTLYYPNQLDSLKKKLLDTSFGSSRIIEKEKNQSLIYTKWLFFLILLLLTIEWLTRKREGFL